MTWRPLSNNDTPACLKTLTGRRQGTQDRVRAHECEKATLLGMPSQQPREVVTAKMQDRRLCHMSRTNYPTEVTLALVEDIS